MLDFVLSILHVISQSSKKHYEIVPVSHFVDEKTVLERWPMIQSV